MAVSDKPTDPAMEPTKEIHIDSSAASSISDQQHATTQAVEAAQMPPTTTPQDPVPEDEYPSLSRTIPVMISLFLSMFLVALDRLIVATAIPVMTNEFHSFGDIGWYSGAYLLPCCALQVIFGRLYSFYSPKWLFLTFIVFFEIGSAICGAAPNSIAFIMGRVIAGASSAGVQNGAINVMMAVVPLHKRAGWQGFFGAVFGVASILGPIVGGALTTNVSWRWCYYINLPIGGAVILVNLFVLRIPPSRQPREKLTVKEQIARLDPLGTVVFIASVVCLLLALQWGGATYPWDSGRIIALFVVFAVLLIAFIGIQAWKKESATIPPRVFLSKTVAAGAFFTFCIAGSMLLLAYWLPVWFQAIKGVSAVQSGIDFLPLILSMVLSSILTGIVVQKVGYYTPPILMASIITPIGAGLISTFYPGISTGRWIGYQIIFGFGLGFGLQQPVLAVQNVLPKKDAPIGVAIYFFFNTFAGAVFVSVGQAILNNKLSEGLATIPGLMISPAALTSEGATNLRNLVPATDLPLVLDVYNNALRNTFYLAVGLTCASLLGAVWIPWKKIVKPPQAQKAAPAPAAATSADASEKV